MKEGLSITAERIDDFVLFLALMQQMELPTILDRQLPRHWLQQGLIWGWFYSSPYCLDYHFVVFPADGEESPSSEVHPIPHRVPRVEDHRHAIPDLLLWAERESATAKRTVLSGHIVSPGCSHHPTAPPIACFDVYLCHHGLDASFAFSDVLSFGAENEEPHDDAEEHEYAKQEFRKRP